MPHTSELLRLVNETIAGVFPTGPDETVAIVCECEARACGTLIEVPLGEFLAAVDSHRYFVVPGHEIAGAVVVRTELGYEVVEAAVVVAGAA